MKRTVLALNPTLRRFPFEKFRHEKLGFGTARSPGIFGNLDLYCLDISGDVCVVFWTASVEMMSKGS